ncbi:hypothetical protein [Paenibacillus medicaginis]|uniref:Uncharacterized protein n=1 Tax=Paenibacillus medicaginis TaxID=1470560 RepID=A0ABV5BV12_9BACL
MTIIGYDFYGPQFFRSPGGVVKDMYYGELKNGQYDQLEIRERTDVPTDSVKVGWNTDTRAIFEFTSDLEGGNITNGGLEIVSFLIRRRRADELTTYTLDKIPFVNNSQIEYVDKTQPNANLIYSIVPLAENAIDGKAVSVQAESDFVGWWIVDKATGNTLGFDQAIDDLGEVETELEQGRSVIETFSKYPTIYYSEKEYHTFTLEAALIPEELERSGYSYEKIKTQFISNHKPFLVKSDNGRLFVCDISNPTFKTPQNTWHGYDYATLSLEFTEIGTYEDYMNGVL